MRKLELDSINIFAIAFSPAGQIIAACVDMNIQSVSGLSEAQKISLRSLGAID